MAIALVRAQKEDRVRDIALFGVLLLWLVYTRFLWTLEALHATLPPCPFYTITGHPCPFCGGTRSFAYMWQGDLLHSLKMYPLGPLLFAGTVAGVVGTGIAAISGRTLRLISGEMRIVAVAAVLFGVSWALKLVWLGN